MEDINCWESKFKPCYYSDKLLHKLFELNKQAKNKLDIREIKKAIYYAKKYHGEQKRQSGESYYSHPLEVAYILAEYTAQEDCKYFKTDMIVTSILHDTVEDTTLTLEVITLVFGSKIAQQVEDLIKIKKYGKISSAKMVELLFNQGKYEMLLIKEVDRLHNILTVNVNAKSPEKIS